MVERVCPSTTTTEWLATPVPQGGEASLLRLLLPPPRGCRSSTIPSSCASRSPFATSRTNTSEVGRQTRAEWAMLMAVSRLSPVSIQILMLARLSRSMVSGTPFCNLSSMAVAPISSSDCSIWSAAASIRSSLSTRLVVASSKTVFQRRYSCSGMYLWAKSSVRRPSVAKSSRCWKHRVKIWASS
ncbi:hypothetical protein VTK73DRAFT_1298 [Phialemonium thermophilum]|uniref:Uncharacterized protein n=1 Tax=Phialemonium thermophilum TaxID=223376 RepID=A0ABR3VTN2_9PEZI